MKRPVIALYSRDLLTISLLKLSGGWAENNLRQHDLATAQGFLSGPPGATRTA